MNALQIFNNEEFGQVRTLVINNEPHFVGKDVAEVLGYVKPLNAIATHVDEDDSLKQGLIDSMGRNQQAIFINESGLYSLILSSKLSGAKKFKRWVTSEVLPQIRKTGGYIPIDEEESDEDILAKALLIAQNTLMKKDELLKAKDKELEGKNKFLNQLAASKNSLLVREVAKIASKENIKIGERRLWEKLRSWGLIFKKTTEPMQKGIDQGLFEVVEGAKESYKGVFTYHTTRVTGKGQAYIINKLLEESEVI
ncbi:phage antirepressor [Clostridium sp.]|uniref:phage antirepressor n=1 Tax=Clostridium sp. TaxID=1506 RepID=UPI00261DE43C|nr:phage antirepressor [Clostridium sp.]